MVGGARKRVKIESSTRQYDEYAVTTPNNENATSERNARRKGKRIGDFARKIGCFTKKFKKFAKVKIRNWHNFAMIGP